VVIAYDHAGHYFHELLGYMTAASVLGISLRIIAAKLVDPAIAAQLHSERAIDSLPHTWGIHPPNVVDQLVAFADEQGDLASLWSALDDCDLGSRDMVFPHQSPSHHCPRRRVDCASRIAPTAKCLLPLHRRRTS
jgi:hypothetical protein